MFSPPPKIAPHSVLLAFFDDDLTVVGTAEELGAVLDRIATTLERETGLRLNVGKCRAWRTDALDDKETSIFRERGITVEPPEKGVELLGSAIGSDEFVESFLQSEVEGIEHQAHILLDVLEYGKTTGDLLGYSEHLGGSSLIIFVRSTPRAGSGTRKWWRRSNSPSLRSSSKSPKVSFPKRLARA